jgi:hypothetical protein
MSELKTKPNDADVLAFLDQIEDEAKKADSLAILKMMQEATDEPAKMWGNSIIGFGQYHYKYASGREGDWFLTGFSPRKQQFSLYIMAGFDQYDDLLSQLGKYKTGKSCLYIKRLSDVNQSVLNKLIEASVDYMNRNYDT